MQKYMAVIPLNKKISFWEIKRNDKYNTEKSIYKSAIVRFKIAAQYHTLWQFIMTVY